MESFSDSGERTAEQNESETIRVGDQVEYRRDGTRGIVYSKEGELCQILWEDEFVSWEKWELLKKRNPL